MSLGFCRYVMIPYQTSKVTILACPFYYFIIDQYSRSFFLINGTIEFLSLIWFGLKQEVFLKYCSLWRNEFRVQVKAKCLDVFSQKRDVELQWSSVIPKRLKLQDPSDCCIYNNPRFPLLIAIVWFLWKLHKTSKIIYFRQKLRVINF